MKTFGPLLYLLSLACSANCLQGLRLHVDHNTLMPTEQAELRWLQQTMASADCPLTVINSAAATTKRRLSDLRDGHSEVWFGASKTASRQTYLYFSVPYYVDEVRRYVRKGEQARCTGDDFAQLLQQGCRVIGPSTGWYGDAYERFRERYQHDERVMYYRYHVHEALRLLRLQRADLLISTKRQMAEVENEWNLVVDYLPPALVTDPLHVVFSKRALAPEEFDRINAALLAAIPQLTPSSASDAVSTKP